MFNKLLNLIEDKKIEQILDLLNFKDKNPILEDKEVKILIHKICSKLQGVDKQSYIVNRLYDIGISSKTREPSLENSSSDESNQEINKNVKNVNDKIINDESINQIKIINKDNKTIQTFSSEEFNNIQSQTTTIHLQNVTIPEIIYNVDAQKKIKKSVNETLENDSNNIEIHNIYSLINDCAKNGLHKQAEKLEDYLYDNDLI